MQEATTQIATVNVARVPGHMRTIVVQPGATIAEVLTLADLDPAGYAIRLSGDEANVDSQVSDGDTVLLTRQVKGN